LWELISKSSRNVKHAPGSPVETPTPSPVARKVSVTGPGGSWILTQKVGKRMWNDWKM
jgi:hypothetical protein